MIKNLIFDFDGVIVDSEIIVARSLSTYLAKRNIKFEEKDFFKFAGNKTIEIISHLSKEFQIIDKEEFYNDIMMLAKDLYSNQLRSIKGVEKFLENTSHNRLIGSNNIKSRIIDGLKKINLSQYFCNDNIFSFDIVGQPKPDPAIYLKAIEVSEININETIIIEDSVIGVQAGVAAGIKVIGLTAGGHWDHARSDKELYDAGAYEVVSNYNDMLLLIDKL